MQTNFAYFYIAQSFQMKHKITTAEYMFAFGWLWHRHTHRSKEAKLKVIVKHLPIQYNWLGQIWRIYNKKCEAYNIIKACKLIILVKRMYYLSCKVVLVIRHSVMAKKNINNITLNSSLVTYNIHIVAKRLKQWVVFNVYAFMHVFFFFLFLKKRRNKSKYIFSEIQNIALMWYLKNSENENSVFINTNSRRCTTFFND